jgi:hypothetical protein
MDKENVVYIHNGKLFNHKMEWNSVICGNMDKPREHYAKNVSQAQKEKQCMISCVERS